MALMRTANPALNKKTFENFLSSRYTDEHMSIEGTVNKTFLLLILLMITAFYSWTMLLSRGFAYSKIFLYGGAIAGFVVALATIFKKEWSPVTAPIYALVEGVVLGSVSSMLEFLFPGIVMQAVALTFGTLLCLLLAYKSGFIKATENFKLGVFAATGAIAVIYIITFIMGFFGKNMPYIHESGTIGILFSLFVVVIAALNLVLDFDFIESGANQKAPKYMEWYAAFGRSE